MLKFNIVKATLSLNHVTFTHFENKKTYEIISSTYDSQSFYQLDVSKDSHTSTYIIMNIASQFMDNDDIVGYEWISDTELYLAFNASKHTIYIA